MTTVVAATSRSAASRRSKVPKVLRDDGNDVKDSKGAMVPRDAAAGSFTTKRAKPFMLIDPRYSKFAQHWDICTMAALIFTAIITPFEVAFLSVPLTVGFFGCNNCVSHTFEWSIIWGTFTFLRLRNHRFGLLTFC